MDDAAIARWVRRHPQPKRFQAAFEWCDVAIEQVAARVRERDPGATARDIRAYIRRMKEA